MADNPLRVLVVGSKYPPEYAGAGFRIHRTYKRLAKKFPELEWSVVTNSIEFKKSEIYKHDEVHVRRITGPSFLNLHDRKEGLIKKVALAVRAYWVAVKTFRVLAGSRFDLVHVFGMSGSTTAAILWARVFGKPLIIELVTGQATPFQVLPRLNYGNLLKLHRQTAIIAISDPLAQTCREAGLTKNVWSRPNPVDESRFNIASPAERMRLRKELTPFNKDDVVLAMVAKFMPQKNQIFLLEVMAKLPETYKLVLAGPVVSSGPLFERDHQYLGTIRAEIERLGLEERVKITEGYVDAASYMKLSDVYMLPNLEEGLATPMLESIASGVPVVANKMVPAFRQWIEDGENGFIKDLDSALWAEAVKSAACHRGEKMKKASQAILSRASQNLVDSQFFSILSSLCTLGKKDSLNVGKVLSTRVAG